MGDCPTNCNNTGRDSTAIDGKVTDGAKQVFVNGRRMARKGDDITNSNASKEVINEGSNNVTVEGLQAARLGDCSTGQTDECYPPRPGTEASGDVFVNSKAAHRDTDKWQLVCCPQPPDQPVLVYILALCNCNIETVPGTPALGNGQAGGAGSLIGMYYGDPNAFQVGQPVFGEPQSSGDDSFIIETYTNAEIGDPQAGTSDYPLPALYTSNPAFAPFVGQVIKIGGWCYRIYIGVTYARNVNDALAPDCIVDSCEDCCDLYKIQSCYTTDTDSIRCDNEQVTLLTTTDLSARVIGEVFEARADGGPLKCWTYLGKCSNNDPLGANEIDCKLDGCDGEETVELTDFTTFNNCDLCCGLTPTYYQLTPCSLSAACSQSGGEAPPPACSADTSLYTDTTLVAGSVYRVDGICYTASVVDPLPTGAVVEKVEAELEADCDTCCTADIWRLTTCTTADDGACNPVVAVEILTSTNMTSYANKVVTFGNAEPKTCWKVPAAPETIDINDICTTDIQIIEDIKEHDDCDACCTDNPDNPPPVVGDGTCYECENYEQGSLDCCISDKSKATGTIKMPTGKTSYRTGEFDDSIPPKEFIVLEDNVTAQLGDQAINLPVQSAAKNNFVWAVANPGNFPETLKLTATCGGSDIDWRLNGCIEVTKPGAGGGGGGGGGGAGSVDPSDPFESLFDIIEPNSSSSNEVFEPDWTNLEDSLDNSSSSSSNEGGGPVGGGGGDDNNCEEYTYKICFDNVQLFGANCCQAADNIKVEAEFEVYCDGILIESQTLQDNTALADENGNPGTDDRVTVNINVGDHLCCLAGTSEEPECRKDDEKMCEDGDNDCPTTPTTCKCYERWTVSVPVTNSGGTCILDKVSAWDIEQTTTATCRDTSTDLLTSPTKGSVTISSLVHNYEWVKIADCSNGSSDTVVVKYDIVLYRSSCSGSNCDGSCDDSDVSDLTDAAAKTILAGENLASTGECWYRYVLTYNCDTATFVGNPSIDQQDCDTCTPAKSETQKWVYSASTGTSNECEYAKWYKEEICCCCEGNVESGCDSRSFPIAGSSQSKASLEADFNAQITSDGPYFMEPCDDCGCWCSRNVFFEWFLDYSNGPDFCDFSDSGPDSLFDSGTFCSNGFNSFPDGTGTITIGGTDYYAEYFDPINCTDLGSGEGTYISVDIFGKVRCCGSSSSVDCDSGSNAPPEPSLAEAAAFLSSPYIGSGVDNIGYCEAYVEVEYNCETGEVVIFGDAAQDSYPNECNYFVGTGNDWQYITGFGNTCYYTKKFPTNVCCCDIDCSSFSGYGDVTVTDQEIIDDFKENFASDTDPEFDCFSDSDCDFTPPACSCSSVVADEGWPQTLNSQPSGAGISGVAWSTPVLNPGGGINAGAWSNTTTCSYAGNTALQAATVSNNGASTTQLDFNSDTVGGGTFSVRVWVETETGSDFLVIYLNGTPVDSFSGTGGGWQSSSFNVPGNQANTIAFSYEKDTGIRVGCDSVIIDNPTYTAI